MDIAAELSLFYGDNDAFRKKERAVHDDGYRRYWVWNNGGGIPSAAQKRRLRLRDQS